MTETNLIELDAWIAENVMGRKLCIPCLKIGLRSWRNAADDGCSGLPYYTTDRAAAMEVLEKCIKRIWRNSGFSFKVEIFWADVSQQWCINVRDKHEFSAQSKKLELAICLFAQHLFKKD